MKPNDKAIEAARAEGKRWQEGLNRPENQIPCWKVLREADDGYDGYDVIAKFNSREGRDKALERLRAEAMLTAAYAAQFKSEDYAGLIEELRLFGEGKAINDAADALEAVLADRDALMAVNAEFSVVFKERDAAIAERDALAARLAICERMMDKEYRDAFTVADNSNTVAAQIVSMRHSRKWTQKELAEKCGMHQPQISALEDPDFENFEVATLQRVASAFDVALLVRFVPFSELARLAPVDDDSRHLTTEEQKVFNSALRRSAKIKPKQSGAGNE